MHWLSNGENNFDLRNFLKVKGRGQTLKTLKSISRKRYEIEILNRRF